MIKTPEEMKMDAIEATMRRNSLPKLSGEKNSFKVWLQIERVDEANDDYENLIPGGDMLGEFKTAQDAFDYADSIRRQDG